MGMHNSDRKRVLLLGTTGLLGSDMVAVLPRRFTTYSPKPRASQVDYTSTQIWWLSSKFDASDPETLNSVLEEADPDVIVNCVATTVTSPLANDAVANILVNSLFPHRLASLAYARHIYVIHFSTDGVFSGAKGNYTETDIPDPPDLYGRSKLLGEVTRENCLTIRTSFFGLNVRRKGLVEWLLQQQGKTIKGFARSIFSGLSASTLARLVSNIITREIPLSGLYHVGGFPINKYDFLVTLARTLEVDVAIEAVDIPVLDRSLCSDRFWEAMQLPVPTVQDMVDDLKHELGQRLKRPCVERKSLADTSDRR